MLIENFSSDIVEDENQKLDEARISNNSKMMLELKNSEEKLGLLKLHILIYHQEKMKAELDIKIQKESTIKEWSVKKFSLSFSFFFFFCYIYT